VILAFSGLTGERYDQIRKNMYAASFGERDAETAAVACPVFGADQKFLGALSVYLTLGLLFTFLFVATDRFQGAPFFAGNPPLQRGDFVFFSFTTLTTTGYGNLVPAAQPGKLFAGFEMLMGQIFLVTLIAGLVSLWKPTRGQR
jgi:voltage-gated potassium channel Kch